MKTLYLDCGMGAAGDMLCAALLELFPDPDAVIADLNGIGIPHVVFEKTPSVKCGISGTHITVRIDGTTEHEHAEGHHHGDHAHRDLASVETVIAGLSVSEQVKSDALQIYRSIAEAEGHVHGRPVGQIHFHEVGSLDAIADVTAFCLMMERLAPDTVIASAVRVGSGTVHCAHGILPVPAPATAYLLRDVPIYAGEISGELCTPTGAALLRHFAASFAPMPVMRVAAIGYGMGTKDFPAANCVRAMLGESEAGCQETVSELSANIDDMTAEQIGFAAERLFEAGAVDVFTIPVGMKKSRPGTLLKAVCPQTAKEAVLQAFFLHTTTLGVRETETKRYVLSRRVETRETALGAVRVKHSEGYGVQKEKIEYEDLKRIALMQNISIADAERLAKKESERHG